MIIGENFIFNHTPKCGGMSVTRWILNNVDGPLTVVVPENTFEHTREMVRFDDVLSRLTLINGKRHETLPETKHTLEALGRKEPEFVISIIRDPYALLRSYFYYLQQPHIVKRHAGKFPRQRAAIESGFEGFCKTCKFFGYDENEVIDFFHAPSAFDRVDLVPLQHVSDYLTSRFSSHQNFGRAPLETRNKTEKPRIAPLEAAKIRDIVYKRFHLYSGFYQEALSQFGGKQVSLSDPDL